MNNDLFSKWNGGYKFSSTKSNDRKDGKSFEMQWKSC